MVKGLKVDGMEKVDMEGVEIAAADCDCMNSGTKFLTGERATREKEKSSAGAWLICLKMGKMTFCSSMNIYTKSDIQVHTALRCQRAGSIEFYISLL